MPSVATATSPSRTSRTAAATPVITTHRTEGKLRIRSVQPAAALRLLSCVSTPTTTSCPLRVGASHDAGAVDVRVAVDCNRHRAADHRVKRAGVEDVRDKDAHGGPRHRQDGRLREVHRLPGGHPQWTHGLRVPAKRFDDEL